MFTGKQLDKLSNVFFDIAKGIFLASFAVPIITKSNPFVLVQGVVGSLFFLYIGLRFTRLSERKET